MVSANHSIRITPADQLPKLPTVVQISKQFGTQDCHTLNAYLRDIYGLPSTRQFLVMFCVYSYTPEDTNENRRRSAYQGSSASIPVFLLLLSDREPAVSYVRVLRDGRLGPDSDFEAQRSIQNPQDHYADQVPTEQYE